MGHFRRKSFEKVCNSNVLGGAAGLRALGAFCNSATLAWETFQGADLQSCMGHFPLNHMEEHAIVLMWMELQGCGRLGLWRT